MAHRRKFNVPSTILLILLFPKLNHAFEVMYESFEQVNGTDTVEFLMRVRKVNRTTAALDGEIVVKKPLTNEYKLKLDFYHSPMGNQQFNLYAMKIPPTGICDFTRDTWPNYEKYYKDFVSNLVLVGECPIEPRTAKISNHLLVPEMFYERAPNGLWKVHVLAQTDDGDGFFVIWHMKATTDGHF